MPQQQLPQQQLQQQQLPQEQLPQQLLQQLQQQLQQQLLPQQQLPQLQLPQLPQQQLLQVGPEPGHQHLIGMPLANPSSSMLFAMQGALAQHHASAQALDDQEKLESAALAQKYALQRSQQRAAEAFTAGQQMAWQHISTQPSQPIGRPLMPQQQLLQQQLLPQLMAPQQGLPPQAQQPQLSQQQLVQLLLLQQQQQQQP